METFKTLEHSNLISTLQPFPSSSRALHDSLKIQTEYVLLWEGNLASLHVFTSRIGRQGKKNLDKDAAPIVTPSQWKFKFLISWWPGHTYKYMISINSTIYQSYQSHLVRLTSLGRAFAAQAKLSIRSWPWGIRNVLLDWRICTLYTKHSRRRTILQFDKQSEAGRFNPITKLHATHFINLNSSSFRALKIEVSNY